MIRLFYFIRLALHNLRRGGQRSLVALLCITFGVTALVALSMIAKSIEGTLLVGSAERIGGDLSLSTENDEPIGPAQIAQLDALRQSGQISLYTLIAYNTSSIAFHSTGSGEMHFVGTGMGIQPDQYPLAGSLTIAEPGSTGLATLLRQLGDTVITRDIARDYHLKVGDALILSDLHSGRPVAGNVRGIASDTPNHQGDKLYYTLETAQKLANGQPVINTVIVNAPHPRALATQLDGAGWSVDWVADPLEKPAANLWVLGLRGAGLLGLLVGGIGIANTMQGLLRRRRKEIAIWKTLGYRASDLRLIFSFEAGLLGLSGSLLGAGLGILISGQVLELFRSTSNTLYEWSFSALPPLLGILIGTLTTLIFAFWAIIISGQASPMALLRNEGVEIQPVGGCLSIGLGLLLVVPFTLLASLVMESLAAGIGMLICILIGIVLLGGFLNGLLWVGTYLLPLRGLPLAGMAIQNLQRRGASLVFAMLALFIGVLAMSVGLLVAQFSQHRISSQSIDGRQGYNLNILAGVEQESAIRQALAAQNPEKVAVGYRAALSSLRLVGDGEALNGMDAVLVGRSDPQDDYIISGASWGSQPEGVYVYQDVNLKVGRQVQVSLRDGRSKILTVVGSYELNPRSLGLYPPAGLLMSAQGFTQVTQPDALVFFVEVSSERLSSVTTALGASLPQTTVIDLEAYAARFMRAYKKLFFLPMVISGLALLAGMLLVANSLSLALLDRRHEIGILKTLGYARRQILSIFAVEYGWVALLASGAAVFSIEGLMALFVLAKNMSASVLLLSIPALALAAVCGSGLTILTVLGISWVPTNLPPAAILNERN
jgi:putative ABC transport system permease protein